MNDLGIWFYFFFFQPKAGNGIHRGLEVRRVLFPTKKKKKLIKLQEGHITLIQNSQTKLDQIARKEFSYGEG